MVVSAAPGVLVQAPILTLVRLVLRRNRIDVLDLHLFHLFLTSLHTVSYRMLCY